MDLFFGGCSIPAECVLAYWLFKHPGCRIHHSNGTFYVYDAEKQHFLYCKPGNKVRKDWYRARGMDSWLLRARRHFSDILGEEDP